MEPLQELYDMRLMCGCTSAAVVNALPHLRHRVAESQHRMPQRTAHAMGSLAVIDPLHTRSVSVLACKQIFSPAQSSADAELYSRYLRRARPCRKPS